MIDTDAVDVTLACPGCGEWVRARVERLTGAVEFVDLGRCAWGMHPAHPTSYDLACERQARALDAAGVSHA